MTIPKPIYTELGNHKEEWRLNELKGCDIYIDGLSFINRITFTTRKRPSLTNFKGRESTIYETIFGECIKELQFLQSLLIKSVVILIPVEFGQHKIQFRIDKENGRHTLINCKYDVLPVLLDAAYKLNLQVKYTNNYVENAVVNYVENSGRPQKTVLISKFPDLLQFNTPLSDYLYMSDMRYSAKFSSRANIVFKVIPVSKALTLLPPQLKFDPPYSFNDFEIEFNDRCRRNVYEQIVCGKTHGRMFYFATTRWTLEGMVEQPYDFMEVSVTLFKIFFGSVAKNFLSPTDLQTKSVEIWSLFKGGYQSWNIDILEGDELDVAVTAIKQLSIVDLFKREATPIFNKHSFPPAYLHCLEELLQGVCDKKLVPNDGVKCNDLVGLTLCMAYLRAFIGAVELIDEIYDFFSIRKLKYDCTTAKLEHCFVSLEL